MFGTGLTTPLKGLHQTVVADLNASGLPIVSIDLPSGLSADTPELIGDCVDATVTITLAAPKLPLILPPAEQMSGEVVIADIGIPLGVIDQLDGPRIELITRDQLRDADSAARHRRAQGRLRPRADRRRLGGEDRGRAPGGAWARCARVRAW